MIMMNNHNAIYVSPFAWDSASISTSRIEGVSMRTSESCGKFWIVIGDSTTVFGRSATPSDKYTSYAAALDAAESLTRLDGTTFYVMEAKCSVAPPNTGVIVKGLR